MSTRREFLKRAALGCGAAAWSELLFSVDKAFAIAPDPGTTFLDAEHVVVLMQENRSFDHAFGTLRGVRGFGDPRAMRLPNGKSVWTQTNDAGETFAPFRLNIKDSNATWMGSLPHSWTDQVDARNGGRCDKWLQAKRSGHDEYAEMPLTLGYYTRDDIPFYYALADAFTVCDQHFCSSLTGTTPNRLYLWTGTLRAEANDRSKANVQNSDVDYDSEASWTTFPEVLARHGVSWKTYQNELSVGVGLGGEAEDWLANFTDNPLEWFTQYGVRYLPAHHAWMHRQRESLAKEYARLRRSGAGQSADGAAELAKLKARIEAIDVAQKRWSRTNFEKLPEAQQRLHQLAFTTNTGDKAYHELTELVYQDGDVTRKMAVPKGDVLYQFRRDVETGKLPTVSWIVAPARFSDHPGSPWYGAWYLSEVLEILTQRPEVWKKTIFILTYDENDGYFDHVPPFAPPHPGQEASGKTSAGVDAAVEYVTLEQEKRASKSPGESRENSIGLGFRVPMVLASPWSRGGAVCSQVFDHTSVLQFLETLLSHKTGREVRADTISQWRRLICGDLTSAFRPAEHAQAVDLPFHDRDEFVESIHRAQYMPPPAGFRRVPDEKMAAIKRGESAASIAPQQEPGTRPSTPLPYELDVNGAMDGEQLRIAFSAGAKRFGPTSAGAPFIAYAALEGEELNIRNYAVAAGDKLEDVWRLDAPTAAYDVSVIGPNGYVRQFKGRRDEPPVDVAFREAWNAGRRQVAVALAVSNRDSKPRVLVVSDRSYGGPTARFSLAAGEEKRLPLDLSSNDNWYDVGVQIEGDDAFERRYSGRLETGAWSVSDPAIGRA